MNSVKDAYSVEKTASHVCVKFSHPRKILSSAVLNGGLFACENILNMKVEQNWNASKKDFESPEETLRKYTQKTGLSEATVGMMTSALMNSFRISKVVEQGVEIAVMCTSGTANAKRAGEPAEHRKISDENYLPERGTINIIAVSSAALTDAAMAEALMILTEAKTVVMQNLNIRAMTTGNLATGTGTDSIAFVSGSGPRVNYCGKHVLFGELLAAMLINSLTNSLKQN